jgi:hypothetical protein
MSNNNDSKICWKFGKSTNTQNNTEHNVYIEVPAGNYIHARYAATSGGTGYSLNIIGVETTT